MPNSDRGRKVVRDASSSLVLILGYIMSWRPPDDTRDPVSK